MKILSMTATFGKLQNSTLELKPGLNLINAPNEWGKTTWCAFLVNMLYGIDTRERTTATVLADKDRYAPWSGAPMSGSMRILWQGRDITLERNSKGRVPMGNFRAYETQTGIDVPELTATNCGQTLLGVERSVFTRSGFLKLTDLPVTQDEALRRRLNALVTTGDESGTDDKLEQSLRELKNKCRHNQTGLIPQAEAEQNQLQRQLEHLRTLAQEQIRCHKEQQEQEELLADLENHLVALRYQASAESVQRTRQMEAAIAQTQTRLEDLEALCKTLPDEATAQSRLQTAQELRQRQSRLEMEQSVLPAAPTEPVYSGPTDPEAAAKDAAEQKAAVQKAQSSKTKGIALWTIFMAITVVLLILPTHKYLAAIPAVAAMACLFIFLRASKKQLQTAQSIQDRYPGLAPDTWEAAARSNTQTKQDYLAARERHSQTCEDLARRKQVLADAIAALTPDGDLEGLCNALNRGTQARADFAQAQKELAQLLAHRQDLEELSKPAPAPAYTDKLTLTEAQTRQAQLDAQAKLRKLQVDLGRAQGQMQTLGTEEVLRARLDAVTRRIGRLYEYNSALELALDAMYKAKTGLQRRFAPRLVKRTEELFSRLTDGRYSKVAMAEDLSLRTATAEETTLEPVRVRSDGTTDQLYLALRLAVSQELTPDAPLILDDALVRFDDNRHAKALQLLREFSEHKQVIVFSCQSRTEQ